MANADIAAIFTEIADLLEILGEDPFRINSYRRAGRTLDEATADVAELARQGQVQTLAGIGKSTAAKIEEYLSSGKVAMHEELRAKVPAGLLELMGVHGLGPKTVAKLWRECQIQSLADLKGALEQRHEALEAVAGLGKKKVAQMRESLAFVETVAGRVRLDEAMNLARQLVEALRKCPAVQKVDWAGSLRRWRETIGDIDILCQADEDRAEEIMDAFASAPGVATVLVKGKTKTSVRIAGVQADLLVVPQASYGSALMYFTGSKAHNVALREIAVKRKLRLNEHGLFKVTAKDTVGQMVAGADEEGIYRYLKLPWIAPELREDRGELDAAGGGGLPELIDFDDIRGDFHMHTTQSDGRNSLEEMVAACIARGYKYMAITDHSKSQHQAHGLDEARLLDHVSRIRKLAKKTSRIAILAGVEVDILKDGTLDFAADVLKQLDFVLAAPHSALTSKGPEATDRIIQAIENPCVHAIAHPSGRLLNERPGMELDMVRIAQAAARHGVALEVNAHPMRLDLRDVHVRAAVEAGAKLLINTDAHDSRPDGDLSLMPYGIATARRGWARREDVINTWPAERVLEWLRGSR